MARRETTPRRTQDRHSRVRHKPKARRAEPSTRLTFDHPRYGPIPLIEVSHPRADGSVLRRHEWDLAFQPRMPAGAVRGDPRAQEFCSVCDVPKYFYVDEPRRCLQCGRAFTFWAREQKFWYETLKFRFATTAVRCVDCRRKRRTQRLARAELDAARAQVARAPDDPSHQLERARTLVQLHAVCGVGARVPRHGRYAKHVREAEALLRDAAR